MPTPQELTKEETVTKSRSGLLGLPGKAFLQTFSSHLALLVGTFLLTVFLQPAEYGVFVLIIAVLGFVLYLTDVGLSAALIQKAEEVEISELRASFTVQFLLSLTVAGIIILSEPLLWSFYPNKNGIYILGALSVFVVLMSFKSIPLVLLERNLKLDKVTVIRTLEEVAFYLTVVYLTWRGFGALSFAWAVITRAVTGVIFTFIFQPWLPIPSFSLSKVKDLIRFGFPYQLGSFLTVLQQNGLTLVLAGILGPVGLGFFGWAQKWTAVPMRAFSENIINAAFPAFSRLQNNPQELAASATRLLFSLHALILPTLVGLVMAAPWIIKLIPDYEKWSPALPALIFLSVASGISTHASSIVNILNAIGKAVIATRLIFIWTLLSFIIVSVLAYLYGVNGAAIGMAVTSLMGLIFMFLVARYVQIDFVTAFIKPVIATVGTAVGVFLVSQLFTTSLLWFSTVVLLAVFVYFVILVILQ